MFRYSDPTVDVCCLHFQVFVSCYVGRGAVFSPPPHPPLHPVLYVNVFVPVVVGVEAIVARDDTVDTHTHTPVGLLWTRDLSVAETSSLPHTTDIHVPGGIRTRNPSKRAAADPRVRLRGLHVRLGICCCSKMHICSIICRSFVRWFE